MFNQHVVDGPRQGEKKKKKKSESLPSIFLKRNFDYFITLRCMKKKSAKK